MIDTSTVDIGSEQETPYLDLPLRLQSVKTSTMLAFHVGNELREYHRENPPLFQQIAETAHQPVVDGKIKIPQSVMEWISDFEQATPKEILAIVCEFARMGENGYELVWPVLTVYTPPPAPERDGDGFPNV